MSLLRLSRASPIPLYVQIKEVLRDEIRRELEPGRLLPGDDELCRRYGVSRITVRQALTALAHEGLIRRIQGKGTFVSEPKTVEPLVEGRTFAEEINDELQEPGTEVLSVELIPVDVRHVEILGAQPADRVFKIKLLRSIGREPAIYRVAYLPERFYPRLLASDLQQYSIYWLLKHRRELDLSHAEETVECVRADEYRASLLGIAPNEPLLLVERVVLLADGTPVEFVRCFYRSDRFKLRLPLLDHGSREKAVS